MKKFLKKMTLKAVKLVPLVSFIIVMAVLLDFGLVKGVVGLQNYLGVGDLRTQLTKCLKSQTPRLPNGENKESTYTYNEQIPVETVKAEIVKQAKIFGNDADFMLKLAKCESNFNNLADNTSSTAKGVYQFVANTWEATTSNKKHISEFDYIANIREANIKIANEEYSHWRDCLKK